MKQQARHRSPTRIGAVLAAGLILGMTQIGCLAVGYSSGGGWFLWPGGLGLVVLILIILFVIRRR